MRETILCYLLFLFCFAENVGASQLRERPVEGVMESACPYYLSLCAIFKDEAPYLKEWIEYYLLIGVQHFYLYNNQSSDNYFEVLKPYIDSGIAELTDWPTPLDLVDWTKSQALAYTHCMVRCHGETRWLAVLDIDEFIVPLDCDDLPTLLQKLDSNVAIGAVHINWQCFGTSSQEFIPEDRLMIECLTRKGVNDHIWNRHYKSICKPHKMKKHLVHEGICKSPYVKVSIDGHPFDRPIQIEGAQINHYWTRDKEFFYRVKVERRRQNPVKWSIEEIEENLHRFDDVEDQAILKFVPRLRKRMSL